MKVRFIMPCIGVLLLLGCMTNTQYADLSQAPALKLSFVVDQKYDAENVVVMFRSDDPAGLESRARSMGVDPDVARRIRDASNPSDINALSNRLVQDRFDKERASIEVSKNDFEAQWKDLLPLFSNVVIQTTESPWVHSEYFCVVSSIHPGISSWRGNKVAVRFDRDPASKRRILAHEILLSDVFQLLRKRHPERELSDWQVWAFAEITPVLILDNPTLRPFWPDFPRAGEWFSRSNYPQLADLEVKLKDLFDHRMSYVDYEEECVPVLQAFNQTHRGQ
jgi:hypothetical protein